MFSLKSNGRVNGMHKFEEKDNCYGFCLNDKSNYSNLFYTQGVYTISPCKGNYFYQIISNNTDYLLITPLFLLIQASIQQIIYTFALLTK
jgi:hypothetical protein